VAAGGALGGRIVCSGVTSSFISLQRDGLQGAL